MEMRTEEDISMGQNVTPEILPVAFSLSETFLPSHCSACFLPLRNSQTTPEGENPSNPLQKPYLACNSHPSTALRYCSHPCRDADADCHRLSGECHLLRSPASSCSPDAVSDVRVALRLLFCFEILGFFSLDSGRIGGLMTNREKFDGDEELVAGIREGGRAMAASRRMTDGGCSGLGGEEREENEVEEAALCAVLTNAVEVQVSSGQAVGMAVYGPRFSWFNHSCRPNACYCFSFGRLDSSASGESGFRVSAGGQEDALKRWVSDEGKINYGPWNIGPRVVVRSIRPIRKGEEVCIAYTDVLQPKALRQPELWLKYRFVCCCDRCKAQPPIYVDICLQGSLADLKASSSCLDRNFYEREVCKEQTDCLDQAMEHVAEGNPKACCERLEKMLAENFQNRALEPDAQFLPDFQLQPLHHISLKAYITLASAYRIRASTILAALNDQLDAFELSRAAAAYSLLLAGATHHLFSSDSSLIASVARFWVAGGETLLDLFGSPIWSSTSEKSFDNTSSLLDWRNESSKRMPLNNSKVDMIFYHLYAEKEGIVSWDGFDAMCKGFMTCIFKISAKVWSFLICALPSLKYVKSPVDFRWLGTVETDETVESQNSDLATDIGFCSRSGEGCRHQLEAKKCIEGEERVSVFQLANHCLLYGRYLESICYGPHCYLSGL